VDISKQTLTELEKTISTERLSYFQSAVLDPNVNSWMIRSGILNADREAAVKLHLWNDALSMAFMPSLRIFELTLRNKIHLELCSHFGQVDWWNHQKAKLPAFQRNSISEAIDNIVDKGYPVTDGRVISELNFGFWLSFTSKRMDDPRNKKYWMSCIHNVFNEPDRSHISRNKIHSDLNSVRKIRNRIAHHEPIIRLDLNYYYNIVCDLLGSMCAITNDFMKETSVLPNLLQEDWIEAIVTSRKLIGSKF